MNTFPNPLQINFGEGRIAIDRFTDDDGAQGLILRDSGESHEVGQLTGSHREPGHRPTDGEIYVRCKNRESSLVLMEQVCRVVAGFTDAPPASVYVIVRSSDVRGAVDTWVMPTLHTAMEWAELMHELDREKWETCLTRYDPDGPLTISEAGKERRCRYVGWKQEMDDGSMMQIFEQHICDENGF